MPSTQQEFRFEPIKSFPRLRWKGRCSFASTHYFPAQSTERIGEEQDGWINRLYWGDNLQVMSHLMKEFRGKIDLIYIDPPFDSKTDYKRKIKIKGESTEIDVSVFEEKQYGDIWSNEEYLQFMYERLILMRELLSNNGCIYLHSDWHKSHHLRMLMDEIFGQNNFCCEIIWKYSWGLRTDKIWNKKHDNILMYSKTGNMVFNVNEVLEEREISEATANRLKYKGALITDRNKGRGTEEKALPSDVWYIATINGMASERLNYPTQKPEALVERIIKASSNPGGLVFDCFMGSGTTQAVAMKLGRRFIGADINLDAIQIAMKRLTKIKKGLDAVFETDDKKYTGFKIYNVNNCGFFKNPVQAKDRLLEYFGLQKLDRNSPYDGMKDGRMWKIMPINRIARKTDVSVFTANLPYNKFEKIKENNPNKIVENFTLVCMGHESGLKAEMEKQLSNYKINVEIVDILQNEAVLDLKSKAEAVVQRKGNKLIIKNFYPMNLMQKLSIEHIAVNDWKKLVDSVLIDFNYDQTEMHPTVIDVPEKSKLVKGEYKIPADSGRIKVKITDLISESYETELS
ncbi:MAG: site-specific DNA-methyltransferase [Treponema sp.]|nr:site-specific DNA-methyltransferase [Treponema sp.]